MPERYCIFRTDAIGDLILTLPMAFAVKARRPDAEVTFCVQEYTRPIAELCPAIDRVLAVPGRDVEGAVVSLARRLRRERFDAAVFAYPRPLLALAAKMAGIPHRVGTAYRFYSFLFTSRHSEHRRESVLHESAYNLNLLQPLGVEEYTPQVPLLALPDELRLMAAEVLASIGLEGQRFVILHPGSMGSARDWDAASFGALGQLFTDTDPDLFVLVTGSAKEQSIVHAVIEHTGHRAVALPAPLPLEVFAAILGTAELVVANSTGPLHIASALDVPVVGLYPDEPAQSPRRWGPLGSKAVALTPQTVAKEQVSVNAPMHLITPAHVYEAAYALISGTEFRTGRIKK